MKKIVSLGVICVLILTLSACDFEEIATSQGNTDTQTDVQQSRNQEELPQDIIAYLKNNDLEALMTHFERDYDGFEVYLSSGQRIDFDDDGTIEVHQVTYAKSTYTDGDQIAFDELPDVIQTYVLTNYPDLIIRNVEIDDGMYEIEFTNSLELYFTQSGQLYYVDYD